MATDIHEGTVDLGVVVADAYQHQGIGRRLMRALATTLATNSLTDACCDVLSENALVLAWLRRLLTDLTTEPHGATMTVHGRLIPPLRGCF